ncbi:MAG: hypothetical protein U0136_14135 [Bdellovibrionota bacterium]
MSISSRLISRTTAAILSAALCVGCIPPPRNEPVAYYSKSQLERMGLVVMKVDATLQDSNGNPVGGVLVSAETSHYRELSTTSNGGYFFVQAKITEKEGIDFHFSSPTIDWTETVTDLPKGADKIMLRFLLNPNQTIRLAAVEY